jgi:hypothetical protein
MSATTLPSGSLDEMLATMVLEYHSGGPAAVSCRRKRNVCEDLLDVRFPEPISGDLGELPKALLTLTLCLPAAVHFVRHGVKLGRQVCRFPCVKRLAVADACLIATAGKTCRN